MAYGVSVIPICRELKDLSPEIFQDYLESALG